MAMFDGGFMHFVANLFIIFAFVLWFWLLITAFSDLFRRSDVSGGSKLGWLIVLISLPYLGVFAYLLTQAGGIDERNKAQARQTQEAMRHMVGFSVADELRKLDELRVQGSVTDAEYAKIRARLI